MSRHSSKSSLEREVECDQGNCDRDPPGNAEVQRKDVKEIFMFHPPELLTPESLEETMDNAEGQDAGERINETGDALKTGDVAV